MYLGIPFPRLRRDPVVSSVRQTGRERFPVRSTVYLHQREHALERNCFFLVLIANKV